MFAIPDIVVSNEFETWFGRDLELRQMANASKLLTGHSLHDPMLYVSSR